MKGYQENMQISLFRVTLVTAVHPHKQLNKRIGDQVHADVWILTVNVSQARNSFNKTSLIKQNYQYI